MLNPYEYYRKGIQNPRWRWVIIILTIIYLISPLDILPELLLSIFGYIDDGLLVSILVFELVKLAKK